MLCAESGPELSEGNEDEMKTFNEDIVCSHGDVLLSSANQPRRNGFCSVLHEAQAANVCLMCSICRGSQYPGDGAKAGFP